MDARQRWKVALSWLKNYSTLPSTEEQCYTLLLALSSFSWSQGAAYNSDITPLFSETPKVSYLTSYHIDCIAARIRDEHGAQHGSNATRHIFTTVDQFNAILLFYGNVHTKKEGYHWENLMAIENRVIPGEVNSINGIIHLPEHWVSVVIDFQQQQIYYGDSFGQPMPNRKRKACERWVEHLVNRSAVLASGSVVGYRSLPTGYQEDSISCGLFALNSIGHHYLGHPILPSDPIPLARRRMEICVGHY